MWSVTDPERQQRVQEPDPRVVRAAVDGDLEAFEVLVRSFQEPVWRFVRGVVRDPVLAEDVTQEAFLRAFDRLARFEFRSRFSTWLFSIARNLAIDALRQRERRGLLPTRLGPATPPPDSHVRAELAAAVATLSTKLREALLLVETMGFTCREAGEILGIAEGTVKSRLFHARANLVAWFEEAESEVRVREVGRDDA